MSVTLRFCGAARTVTGSCHLFETPAGRLLVESVQAQFEKVRANYLDHEASYPADWQRAAGASQEVLHVTPAELEEIRASIHEILARNRRLKRHDQPPGARRVHVMLNFTPWFTPDAAL